MRPAGLGIRVGGAQTNCKSSNQTWMVDQRWADLRLLFYGLKKGDRHTRHHRSRSGLGLTRRIRSFRSESSSKCDPVSTPNCTTFHRGGTGVSTRERQAMSACSPSPSLLSCQASWQGSRDRGGPHALRGWSLAGSRPGLGGDRGSPPGCRLLRCRALLRPPLGGGVPCAQGRRMLLQPVDHILPFEAEAMFD